MMPTSSAEDGLPPESPPRRHGDEDDEHKQKKHHRRKKGNDSPYRALHIRKDSDGSVRGAFYEPKLASNIVEASKHKCSQQVLEARERRKNKKRMSMAEMADLAVSSLEQGGLRAPTHQPLNDSYAGDEGGLALPGATAYLSAIREPSTGSASTVPSAFRATSAGSSSAGPAPFLLGDSGPLGAIREPSGGSWDLDDASGGGGGGHGLFERFRQSTVSQDESLRVSEISTASLLGTGLLDFRQTSAHLSSSMANTSSNNSRQQEIAAFSSMASGGYGAIEDPKPSQQRHPSIIKEEPGLDSNNAAAFNDLTWWERLTDVLDPTLWLTRNAKVDEDGNLYFDEVDWSMAGFCRDLFYNPISPEFTSLQQFSWALILGVLMGLYTAAWKMIIEGGLDFVWETIPTFLLEFGVFTDLDGSFPLYHYVWICPALFAGVLSYIFVKVKIPDQNEWITSVHSRGVQDHSQFFPLFVLSTLGMLSGLSLGPELPLVLTAGMIGSYLGLLCKQSMLQARVLNLTAAGAAVGGFFGFPMAGALFVLEIPHRMGLQYFEALSPATISSIVAVLVNRMVTGNEVTGYYRYPFLTSTLPSEIFTHAIFYGLYGAAVGIVYAIWVLKFKKYVHDWFHVPHDDHDHEMEPHRATHAAEETTPLFNTTNHVENGHGNEKVHASKPKKTLFEKVQKCICCAIPQEPIRAAVAGTVAGAIVGVVGMYVPHTLFWGEAQLQNLIDRGRSPLPVFAQGDEPTSAMTALGMCMIDPSDSKAIEEGFSIGCSALISITKTIVIGLSLGTGIIGGHFWGPLFVGCSASHLLADAVNMFANWTGFGGDLAAYPCLIILCTMGSAHVVTFRAHMAIMLILTLTISAFDPQSDVYSHNAVAGDYSAVFPLLVVSVFISLMVSRRIVFYKTQRSRGDIIATPEVLCEPGLEGKPMVVGYDADFAYEESSSSASDRSYSRDENNSTENLSNTRNNETEPTSISLPAGTFEKSPSPISVEPIVASGSKQLLPDALSGLDDLLKKTEEVKPPKSKTLRRMHRRTQSAPVIPRTHPNGRDVSPSRVRSLEQRRANPEMFRFDQASRERSNSRDNLVAVHSYGEIQDHHPSLLDQARTRAASASSESRHRRVPSLPQRKNSDDSGLGGSSLSIGEVGGGLTMEDIEKTFNMLNKSMNKNRLPPGRP